MNLTEDKDQNQTVEAKYLDPEDGFQIKIRKDKLYKIKKKPKIVKPVRAQGFEESSAFNQLDHADRITSNNYILDEFQEGLFLTDDYVQEIIEDFGNFEEEIIIETEAEAEDYV